MARGKHTQAAAVKREAAEQQAEIETYQRKVRELLADLQKTKDALADSERRRKTEVAKAKAQLEAGISPALNVAQRENRTLREERDHARNQYKYIKRNWENVFFKLLDHGKKEHSLTAVEAMEWLFHLMGDHVLEHDTLIDTADFTKHGISAEQMRVIQWRRGERNQPTTASEHVD